MDLKTLLLTIVLSCVGVGLVAMVAHHVYLADRLSKVEATIQHPPQFIPIPIR